MPTTLEYAYLSNAAYGTCIAQSRIEALEQTLDGVGLGQVLAEGPDRVGIGNRIGDPKPKEPLPGQAVTHEIFRGLVAQAIHRLQDQHLEHQHMIERRTTTFGAIRARNRTLQVRTEQREIDRPVQLLQHVALLRKTRQAFFNVKKPRCLHCPTSPPRSRH